MKKLPEYTSDDNMFFYMNALVDLVNSQQEAIEKLAERLELTERRARYACLHALKRENEELADDKAPITTVGIVENGVAIGWGFEWKENTIYPNYNSDGKELIAGYTIEELKKIADDTHRTVTLRIPKEKTLGEALWDAFDQENQNPDISMGEWLLDRPDTDLQKALDKLKGESNE